MQKTLKKYKNCKKYKIQKRNNYFFNNYLNKKQNNSEMNYLKEKELFK